MAQSAELDAQIRQGKEAQRRVDELNRQIDMIRRDLDVFKSIIPVDPETGKLLRVFQTYARDQNLNIASISPSAIAKKELYSEQAYKMTIGGGYHDVALFFDKIAHMRRIVNVSGLEMTAASRKGRPSPPSSTPWSTCRTPRPSRRWRRSHETTMVAGFIAVAAVPGAPWPWRRTR